MPLVEGTRLGPYTIIAPLGVGGMGEVYRARDSRLDRDVAIKVVPELFAADPDRLIRFEREAKALASLSHPHIAHVHEIAEMPIDGGKGRSVAALVMELVEGEDLSARIARGPLPVSEALPIALQIADALESAHESGLIHRDLKPANIKVSADGDVKVLDFGLAKAIEGTGQAADPLNSPTISIAATRGGIILGTAAYMAPEQARGQAVDRRADIWAFGVVLFEMLAGKQAFPGDTISDVLASVLKNDLNWSALPPDLPVPIVRLLQRCLTADRRSRLRDIGEARIAIADYFAGRSDAPATRTAAAPAPSPRSWWILAGALAVITLAAGGLTVAVALLANRRAAPAESRRFVIASPVGVTAHVAARPALTLAPDGWTLVFAGLDKAGTHLYRRGPGDFDPRRLPGTEGGTNPVFAPDGRTIAFTTTSQLKTMPIDGSAATLAPASDPRGVAWIDNDTIVYSPESIGGLVEISARGGTRRPLTTLDEPAGERTHRWPHPLPGGRWVLFTVGTTSSPDDYDNARIDAIDRQTGERRRIFSGASLARYAATSAGGAGHLVLARGGSLYAVRFDPVTLTMSGQPTVVLQGIGGDQTTGAAHVTWTADGTFAYVPGEAEGGLRELVWSDLKGTRQSIPLAPTRFNDIRLSPDGSRVAVAHGTSGVADIWIYAFGRGTYTRVTFTGNNATPLWSADGRDILFSSVNRSGRGSTIFRTKADGGQEPVPLVSVDDRVYLKHVNREASWAIVDYLGFAGARANVGRLPLKAGGKIEPLVETKSDEYGAALSPNGRLLAYQADPDGRPEVFVRALDQASGRWQVSSGGGEEPMWAPDGKSIYFRFEGNLMRVPILSTDPFQSGPSVVLFDGIYNLRSDTGISYQPHPDNGRLLMTRAADVTAGSSIRLVTGWFDELRQIK